MLAACAGNGSKTASATQPSEQQPQQGQQPQITYIETPQVPGFITSEVEARQYMAEHYWDKFDFADSTMVDTLKVEPSFARYAELLGRVPSEVVARGVKRMMHAAEVSKPMFELFAEMGEKYIYDPNSPVRNDEAYIAMLEVTSTTPLYDKWERLRPASQLEMALKNRVGTKALDFTYTLKSGATGTLYGIKARYVLLFINNPGCPACKQLREQISASPMLTDLINQGVVKVLAVYPDEDLKEWRDYQPNMPEVWINSYDRSLAMRDRQLYDLKAIPTLYLLDDTKTVLLKDCMAVEQVEQTIYYRDYYKPQQ